MSKKQLPLVTVTLEKIVGGGQALATMDTGQKLFVWGGLPGETVEVQLTKKKAKLAEGYVTTVVTASDERVAPLDPDSYLSTSPWQIMSTQAEQHYKSALIEEAFELHDIVLPDSIDVVGDGVDYHYRNKVEFSWWWHIDEELLDLAFFRRGTHGKLSIQHTSLPRPEIMQAAIRIRDLLRAKQTSARSLKTLLIRCNQSGDVAAHLYVKDDPTVSLTDDEFAALDLQGLEIILSDPKSPASVITKKLQSFGTLTLRDTILGVPFDYAVEGFFQVNIPIYETALSDMQRWIDTTKPTVDLYSGVGSIGLTIGSEPLTLVEINPAAVAEMRRNITELGKQATAVLASAESVLDHITSDSCVILDPPRAGLHADVVERLIEQGPERIIYLSCNPVTQARDVALLGQRYGIAYHKGYNFFPHTPHIEHLIILDKK